MTKQKKFITCDGNQAAAHISYIYRTCTRLPVNSCLACSTYPHVLWQAMRCVSSVTTRT